MRSSTGWSVTSATLPPTPDHVAAFVLPMRPDSNALRCSIGTGFVPWAYRLTRCLPRRSIVTEPTEYSLSGCCEQAFATMWAQFITYPRAYGSSCNACWFRV